MKTWHSFIVCVFVLFFGLLSFGSDRVQAAAYNVPAPTILGAELQTSQPTKPLVKGLTFNNTIVEVYIDGQFVGEAVVANDSSGVASFAFVGQDSLSYGQHEVYTIARSEDRAESSIKSESFIFTVSYPTPAPILLEPVVDEVGKIAIVGLAKNDLEVEIYIEGVLQVRFMPPAAKSGTTNFWYKPNLPAGEYTVVARTIDNTGKVSSFSTSVIMRVPKEGEVEPAKAENDKEVSEAEEQMPEPEVIDEQEGEAISQSDEFTEKSVEELEEKLPDQPSVLKPETPDTAIVVEDKSNAEGVVKIEDSKEVGEIVLDTTQEDYDITTPEKESGESEKVAEEDLVIFGQADGNNIGEGVAEEVATQDTVDQIQQKNRLTGFIILLVIAVILAIWYVREKKQIEVLEKEQSEKDK